MPNAPSPQVQRWSTREVPPAQRLDYYANAIGNVLVPMRVMAPAGMPSNFNLELHSATCGPLTVARSLGSGHHCERGKRELSRSAEHTYNLIVNSTSPWTFIHNHHSRMRPGDSVLHDSRLGFLMELANFEAVNLQLPAPWLREWVPVANALVGRVIPHDRGWGRALCAYLMQLTPEFVAGSPLPVAVIADQVGALLALVAHELCGTFVAPTRSDRSLHDRVQECVVQRCTESALTAHDVATVLNISTRTLHRSLAANGATFGASLMAARVDLATRMLKSPLFNRLTTAEIGRRAGFSDPSHFVRVLRRRSGSTPSQLRRGARTQSPRGTVAPQAE